MLAWALMVQNLLRIEYIYCFIENKTYQQRDFKVINKQILGELLKLDVLLIE